MDIRNTINLLEEKQKLVLPKLSFSRDELSPVLSKATIDYHYGELSKAYVDRYNKGEGDSDFNHAGSFLHDIYWGHLQAPAGGNKPTGDIENIINRKFGNFREFQKELKEEAMKIQGSGWIYLSRTGALKTIRNHEIRKDAVMVIDMWEHSWALDYQGNKGKYLDNIWRCINWDQVNQNLRNENQ